jgi:hypothetical protein
MTREKKITWKDRVTWLAISGDMDFIGIEVEIFMQNPSKAGFGQPK